MEILNSKFALSQLSKIEKENYGFNDEINKEIINILKEYYLNTINNNSDKYLEIEDINNEKILLNKEEIIKILKEEKLGRTKVIDKKNKTKYINLYHFIAKSYENEIKRMNNILDGISRLSTKDNHLSVIEEIEKKNKNPRLLTVELFDLKDEIFTIKKIFLKFLINKIYNKQELKRRYKVYDIKGNIHIINPNENSIFNILMEISPLGEILLNEDNKFSYEYDINNNKHLVKKSKINFDNNSFISNYSFTKSRSIDLPKNKSIHNSLIHSNKNKNQIFILIFDINNQKYVIPYEQIKNLYDKISNGENVHNIIQFTDYKGKIIFLNFLNIRLKKTKYLNYPNAYFIKDEENISFCLITNCLNGKNSLFPISKIKKVIEENKENEYAEIEKDYVVNIEELKEILISFKENECIKLMNISNIECYIKKVILLNYLNRLITNYLVNEIEKINDIKGNIQYINMKKTICEIIKISPCPLFNDNILIKQDETYIFYKGGMKLQRQILNKENELFQFLLIEDINKESFFIRKPAVRNIIVTYKINNIKIPNAIELTDLNNKKRTIEFKKYYKNYLKNCLKYNGVKIIFIIEEIFVEVFDEKKMKKFLVKKSKLIKLNSGLDKISVTDYKNNLVLITKEMYSKINFKKEWILINDTKKNEIYVYKSIVKGYIRDKINGVLFKKMLKNTKKNKYEEIYDYDLNKKSVNPIEIVNNYTFQKLKNNSREDIIEVLNKI